MAAMPSKHRATVRGVTQTESDLPGRARGAPESYRPRWTCLFRNLELVKGRHAHSRRTSAFGRAASTCGRSGPKVIATTRNRDRFISWRFGAHRVELEGPIFQRHCEAKQIDSILDLVGNSVILDSSRFCGAEDGLSRRMAEPSSNRTSTRYADGSVSTHFFGSSPLVAGFPLSRCSAPEIGRSGARQFNAKPSQYPLRRLREAHRVMEAMSHGKLVVKL